MKQNGARTVTFLLLLLLLTLHLAGDIALGYDKGGRWILIAFVVLGFWIYAVFALGDRRSGLLINLVLSLLTLYVPYLHMIGRGLSGAVARSPNGAFFFIWVTLAIGVTALVSAVLSGQRLWSLSSDRP